MAKKDTISKGRIQREPPQAMKLKIYNSLRSVEIWLLLPAECIRISALLRCTASHSLSFRKWAIQIIVLFTNAVEKAVRQRPNRTTFIYNGIVLTWENHMLNGKLVNQILSLSMVYVGKMNHSENICMKSPSFIVSRKPYFFRQVITKDCQNGSSSWPDRLFGTLRNCMQMFFPISNIFHTLTANGNRSNQICVSEHELSTSSDTWFG